MINPKYEYTKVYGTTRKSLQRSIDRHKLVRWEICGHPYKVDAWGFYCQQMQRLVYE